MKKLILLFAAIAMVGCNSDDGPSTTTGGTSFTYDGTSFQLQPTMGMSEIIMADVIEYNGETYDRSTLSVTGLNGMSSTATVSFDLYYKSGTSIAGTYEIFDTEADTTVDFEEFLVGQERGCLGWTSAGAIFSMSGGTMTTGNNPTGTVKVVVNSPTNYTLTYNGNFRLYQDFEFVENMPADINVTSNVTIQD